MPQEITTLDHRIHTRGGTTSNLDCLPHRLKIDKKQPTSSEQSIRELTRENGYLRQELALYKDIRLVLFDLQEKTKQANLTLQDALRDVTRKVARGEQRLLNYWGVHIDDGNEEIKVF